MRQSRIASGASSLLLATTCVLAGPVAGEAASGSAALGYVALGDSYAAGVGAGDYLPSDAGCRRSSLAYPVLWAATHAPASFDFAACNHARTSDVMANQMGRLGPRTGLVTITVGGSDAGFARVMTTCVLPGQAACLSAVAAAGSFMDSTLPGNLDRLYSAVRNKAPAAHVVVLGYPHLYRLHGTCSSGLENNERSALNKAVDRLDGVIARLATAHGFTFADVRAAFTGHEICSSSPWLHSVDLLDLTGSYHPTAAGQSLGYLPPLTGAS
ncbi:SGNH/GDSL hydrolase family protein [Streptomyces sp. NPDC001348]